MHIPNVRKTLHDLVAVESPTSLMGFPGTVQGLDTQREEPGTLGLEPQREEATEGAPPPLPRAAPSRLAFEAEQFSASLDGSPPHKETIGVFLTPQSLVTFPVASSALVIVWKVLSVVFPAWGASKLVPFVGALLLGMFLYYISLPENASRRVKVIGVGIGLLNSFFLAASALGVQTVTP